MTQEQKRTWYRIVLERDFLKKKGNAFQDFFADIMEKRYPGDFIRIRPWGNVGDRKNDGYLRSQRTLCQVYAPNEMSSTDAVNKIDEDFRGALPYWQDYFDVWIFVHNSAQGLGPDVTRKLLDLSREYPQIMTTSWGFEEVSKIALSLDEDDVIALLGGIIAPREAELKDVTYEDLRNCSDKHCSSVADAVPRCETGTRSEACPEWPFRGRCPSSDARDAEVRPCCKLLRSMARPAVRE